jgi:hypothetical protein
MRHTAMGTLILSVPILGAIAVGSALAQTSPPKQASPPNPPTVREPAKPATPDDRRADGSLPRNGVITPAPGASADTGTTVHPPNVDPGINVAPRGSAGGDTTVTPK